MKTKLVLFGITGDLSRRKLLPALEHIIDSHQCDLSVIGVSRREVNIADLLQSAGVRPGLASHFSVVTMDIAKGSEYQKLKQAIGLQPGEQAVIYLSVPPSASADIVDFLGHAGINTPQVKLLFEKPFGFDRVSADEFLARTAHYFDEAHIYRIDHYAAKDIAQQLIHLRSNAENHHHNWSNQSVASIDVVAYEKIGIEGRAGFYEQTGALRDFIQGHLMQLLSLVLMQPPATLTAEALSQARLAALQQLQPADPQAALRAQYEGYADEAGNPGSTVETFASIKFESDDPRWQGVPLRLVTGKALNRKQSAIIVHYKDGTQDVFEEGVTPIDGLKLDAYERVLLEAIKGNKAIFTTGPEVMRAWELLIPVQEAWSFNQQPLEHYAVGIAPEVLGTLYTA